MTRRTELMALLSVAVVLLLLSHKSHGAPTREGDESDFDNFNTDDQQTAIAANHFARWFLRDLSRPLMLRTRRLPQVDAGFVSRHNAISKYLKALEAQKHANNPYGPGRRR